MRTIPLLALAAVLFAGTADAKPKRQPPSWEALGVETRIAFPNHGSIRNYEANDNRGLWIEDSQGRWYYAELLGFCQGLDFAEAVGFDTAGTSQLDKFGAILVNGQKCQIARLITAEKPMPRKDRIARRKQVREDAKKAVAPKD
jgi:hypothetical protein